MPGRAFNLGLSLREPSLPRPCQIWPCQCHWQNSVYIISAGSAQMQRAPELRQRVDCLLLLGMDLGNS